MTLPWPALALAAFAILAPSAVFAESAHISDLIDELQRIQVKIAQGDKAAYPAQLNQLKTIGAAITTASPETWKNEREADSLVTADLSPMSRRCSKATRSLSPSGRWHAARLPTSPITRSTRSPYLGKRT